MPEIYVHAVKGRTLDQKRALVKDITDAVVKNFGNCPGSRESWMSGARDVVLGFGGAA
jgi:hypothetical protein